LHSSARAVRCAKITARASYVAGTVAAPWLGTFIYPERGCNFTAAHLRGGSLAPPFVPLSGTFVGSLKRLTHRTGYSPVPFRTLAAGAITLTDQPHMLRFTIPLHLLKRLVMPYYRITIWLKYKKKPIQGIRVIEHYNIDLVYNMVWQKARSHYNESLLMDIEVAMLPKRCTSVRNYLNKKSKAN
jgi:hypothetical protein